jgi:hypothetical protein
MFGTTSFLSLVLAKIFSCNSLNVIIQFLILLIMELDETIRSDWEIAETLYQKGWEYYMNNCTLLTADNYQRIQEEIGFPET